jgi:hypothetical protein
MLSRTIPLHPRRSLGLAIPRLGGIALLVLTCCTRESFAFVFAFPKGTGNRDRNG